MKVRTSELTGPALDYAVAKCERRPYSVILDEIKGALPLLAPIFSPSTSWQEGGPIIEREYMSLHDTTSVPNRWIATCHPAENRRCVEYGPTLLVAAMRCYVSKCLGHEVDVPEEICN